MELLSIAPALTLVSSPDPHLVVPPLVAGTFLWLLVVGSRMDSGVRYVVYCAVTAAVAWAGADIVLAAHEQVTSPSVKATPDGGWDVAHMPDAVRILLGIAMGALLPAMLVVCDRVPWRWWTWSLLALFPAIVLTAGQWLPPGADTITGLQFLALGWLAMLPSATGPLLRSPPGRVRPV